MYGGQYISPGIKRGVTYPPIDRNLAPLLHFTEETMDQVGAASTGLDQNPAGEDISGENGRQTGTGWAQQHSVTFATSRRVLHSSSESCLSKGW